MTREGRGGKTVLKQGRFLTGRSLQIHYFYSDTQTIANKPRTKKISQCKECNSLFLFPSTPALPIRGVTVCNMYCFYALLGPLYPASCFISSPHSHLPEMSIVRQNSGTQTPAASRGCPAPEGTATAGTGPLPPQTLPAPCQENGSLEKDSLLIKWT